MTFIYFILIIGITVFIHEFGHFLFAKKYGVYCYEFNIGMGPKLFSFKRKNDETEYCIKLFPIGGSVKMAGEEIEEDKNIPQNKRIQSKTFKERFLVITAGALFNFLLGLLLLFVIGLLYGSPETKPYIGEVDKKYNAYKSGIREGDLIIKIDGKIVKSWDAALLSFELKDDKDSLDLKLKKENGHIYDVTIKPTKTKEDGKTVYLYGFSMTSKRNYGFISSIKYSFNKFGSIYHSMTRVIINLITGKLGLDAVAGPIGVYNVVGEEANNGFENILYLIALICINVGFVNLIPFPAFDGGRAVFLIIEKITKKPINSKIENAIHAVGFSLLILLMIIITIHDIKNIIK